MAHVSNSPRPNDRKPFRNFWRVLGRIVLGFVKPDDWRALTIGSFLAVASLADLTNDRAKSVWEVPALIAICLFGVAYAAASVVYIFKQKNERRTH